MIFYIEIYRNMSKQQVLQGKKASKTKENSHEQHVFVLCEYLTANTHKIISDLFVVFSTFPRFYMASK